MAKKTTPAQSTKLVPGVLPARVVALPKSPKGSGAYPVAVPLPSKMTKSTGTEPAVRGNAVAVTTALVAAFPGGNTGAARSKYQMAAFESETSQTLRDVSADEKYLFAGQRGVWEDDDPKHGTPRQGGRSNPDRQYLRSAQRAVWEDRDPPPRNQSPQTPPSPIRPIPGQRTIWEDPDLPPHIPETLTGEAYRLLSDCDNPGLRNAWWCTDSQSPGSLDFYEAAVFMYYGELATTLGTNMPVPNEAFARHIYSLCGSPQCELDSSDFFDLFSASEAFGRYGTSERGVRDAIALTNIWGDRDTMVNTVIEIIIDPANEGLGGRELDEPFAWFQTRPCNPDSLRNAIRSRQIGLGDDQVAFRLDIANGEVFAIFTPNQQIAVCGGMCVNIGCD